MTQDLQSDSHGDQLARHVKGNYPFVDLIRFISMMGIVWGHVYLPVHENFDITKDYIDHPVIYIAFMQIFKFGVICFYIISGFLLGDMHTITPLVYFKRRLDSILKPYLIALFIMLMLGSIGYYKIHHFFTIASVIQIVKWTVFYNHLWFIPNYFLALTILLVFYKYISSIRFGLVLLVITCLYTVFSVYMKTSTTFHSGLFAYVFYLWLGCFIKRNNLVSRICEIKVSYWAILTALLYFLTTWETYRLFRNDFTYVFSILRVSNQLYSLSMFALLVRVTTTTPDFRILNPRKETYGIYLYHGFISSYLMPGIAKLLEDQLDIKLYSWQTSEIVPFITVFLFCFLLSYSTSTFLVKLMLKYKLAYLK